MDHTKKIGLLPPTVILESVLTCEEKALLAYHLSSGDSTYPDGELAAKELGLGIDEYNNLLNSLSSKGFVVLSGGYIEKINGNPKDRRALKYSFPINGRKLELTTDKKVWVPHYPFSGYISIEAKAIYALLCCFADKNGRCDISTEACCRIMEMPKEKAAECIKELIQEKYLFADEKAGSYILTSER